MVHRGGEGGIRTLDRLTPKRHFEFGEFNHSLWQCLPQRDTFHAWQPLIAPIANSPGRDHRVNGIFVNRQIRSLDLPRDTGAVYKKRAGGYQPTADITMTQ
jgi:hypothetical protein